MTPEAFIAAGQRLYGRRHWKLYLARDIGVDVSTIHRLTRRPQIPGPYEVALKAMLQNRQRQNELEKEARKMMRQRRGRLVPVPPRNRKRGLRHRPAKSLGEDGKAKDVLADEPLDNPK